LSGRTTVGRTEIVVDGPEPLLADAIGGVSPGGAMMCFIVALKISSTKSS
jgi:hypothetical protein